MRVMLSSPYSLALCGGVQAQVLGLVPGPFLAFVEQAWTAPMLLGGASDDRV